MIKLYNFKDHDFKLDNKMRNQEFVIIIIIILYEFFLSLSPIYNTKLEIHPYFDNHLTYPILGWPFCPWEYSFSSKKNHNPYFLYLNLKQIHQSLKHPSKIISRLNPLIT